MGVGVDFLYSFYPAARCFVTGCDPYAHVGFLSPPWLLPLLAPLGLLPIEAAWILFLFLSVLCYSIAFRRLGMSQLCMFSPWAFYGLWHGNIDCLVLLGASLPPAVGIWLLLLKPQMSLVLMALWVSRRRPLLILPTVGTLAFVVSRGGHAVGSPWSTSMWPWSIPVGQALLLLTFRLRNRRYALAASPFLSPYVAIHSWIGVLAILRRPAFVIVLGWLAVYLRWQYF